MLRIVVATCLTVGLFVSLLAPALPSQEVMAANSCVNIGGTDGCFSTIQAAIDDPGTVDGDTINVGPNNPLRPAYIEHVTVDKNVTIAAADRFSTVVNANDGTGIVFTISSGKTVHISGFTTREGVDNGGTLTIADSIVNSLSNRTGSLTLINSTINYVIYNNSTGTVTLTQCVMPGFIDSNGILIVSASTIAGKISNNGSGTLTLTGSTLSSDGTFLGGGAIYNDTGGRATVTNSVVRNVSDALGGGITNLGTVTVTNSTLSGNFGQQGGGIYNSGIATINNSTLDHNTAVAGSPSTGGGGGIFNDTGGNLTLTNSTLNGNVTGGSIGGGILNLGTMKVINSTIANNSASQQQFPPGQGGGIANYGALTMSNTIVANNIAVAGGSDVQGTITSGGHNLIGNTSGGSGFVGGDLKNVNPLLNSPANNGGPTQTMALQAGSPAIGAADLTICTAALPSGAGGYDQRTIPRSSSSCSIGAYEAHPAIPGPVPPPKPTTSPAGSPTALPPARPTAPPPGAGTPTPNPLPPSRP